MVSGTGDGSASEVAKPLPARGDEAATATSGAPEPGAPAAATHAPSAAPEPIAGAADEGATAEHRAPPARDPRRRRRSARVSVDAPTFDTVVSRPEDRGIRLDVSAVLVARARAMAPNLPAEVLGDDDTSEEAVLRAALRLGLAALAALSDDED